MLLVMPCFSGFVSLVGGKYVFYYSIYLSRFKLFSDLLLVVIIFNLLCAFYSRIIYSYESFFIEKDRLQEG